MTPGCDPVNHPTPSWTLTHQRTSTVTTATVHTPLRLDAAGAEHAACEGAVEMMLAVTTGEYFQYLKQPVTTRTGSCNGFLHVNAGMHKQTERGLLMQRFTIVTDDPSVLTMATVVCAGWLFDAVCQRTLLAAALHIVHVDRSCPFPKLTSSKRMGPDPTPKRGTGVMSNPSERRVSPNLQVAIAPVSSAFVVPKKAPGSDPAVRVAAVVMLSNSFARVALLEAGHFGPVHTPGAGLGDVYRSPVETVFPTALDALGSESADSIGAVLNSKDELKEIEETRETCRASFDSLAVPSKRKALTEGEDTEEDVEEPKGTQSLNPHNDYCQHFVDTGHRPQNFIRDVGLADRFEEYPKLRELIRLKDELISTTNTPPMYLQAEPENFDLQDLKCKFDVILIMKLEIEEISDLRSFVFLWCGSGEGLDMGRMDICWIKTNKNNPGKTKALDPKAVFQRTRSTDGDFIHANVDIDLIITEEPEMGNVEKPVEIFHIIEHFCLGRRRLADCRSYFDKHRTVGAEQLEGDVVGQIQEEAETGAVKETGQISEETGEGSGVGEGHIGAFLLARANN
ncbi:hypothetical protein F7725_005428 [Dissostichus mawsoni]|uniref:N(6)-adenosine-methyltransferase non-catalytic subunit METTL14 n=1 Tax=Dissostichus mawsoni TaxID=36200 RepID=A0A7J5YSE4_DISMA|nr:hypothetical protein F7725_005428 [Dissostichus mawsoni]